MEDHSPNPRPLAAVSTGDLLKQVVERTTELVKKEIELAKAELRTEKDQEIRAFTTVGGAALTALLGVQLALFAAVLALATVIPGWAAALAIAAPFLVGGMIAGTIGWKSRVKQPLERTRRTLEENAHWIKESVA